MAALADPAQRYSLYLPPGYPGGRIWPLLVILDPRGRADDALGFALGGARRNGWIVMSAEGSRSDVPQAATLAALQALLTDAEQRYAIDSRRLYLAGMSGTAKTLWPVAQVLRARVAGLVGCAGAPTPREVAALRPPPPFAGCSGRRDFNHASMRALDDALDAAGAPHRLDTFAGLHGWRTDLGPAIDWLQFQSMRDGRAPLDGARVDALFAEARAAAAAADLDVLARQRALDQLVRDFDGLRDVAAQRAQRDQLARDPALSRLRAAERALHDDERRYQLAVDAWFARIAPRGGGGASAPRAPPTLAESLRMLQVARLKRLAADPDPARADSAWRRLALARGAAGAYAPERARAQGDEAMARAALAVAAAIGPLDPGR
jgi:dienelactone hydrolase